MSQGKLREKIEAYLMITYGRFFEAKHCTNMYREAGQILSLIYEEEPFLEKEKETDLYKACKNLARFSRPEDCDCAEMFGGSLMEQYTKEEAFMIMCITRSIDCTPDRCKKCGWLRSEVRESIGGLSDNQLLAIAKVEGKS